MGELQGLLALGIFLGVSMIYQHKLAMVLFFTGMGMLLGSIFIIAAFIR